MEYLVKAKFRLPLFLPNRINWVKNKVNNHVEAYKKQLLAGDWAEMPPYFVTSSLEAIGREGILEYINQINEDIFKNEGF